MALDPRIPLGIQPLRLESPLDTAGQAMQIQALQQRAQLGQMQMQQLRAQQAQQAELQDIARQSGGDIKGLIKGLYDRGHVEMAMGLEAKLAEQRNKKLTGDKTLGEIHDKNFGLRRDAYAFMANDPRPEKVASTLESLVRIGAMTKEEAQAEAGALGGLPQQEWARYLAGQSRNATQTADVWKPNYQVVDDNKTKRVIDTNLQSNPNAAQPIQMQTTPGQDLASKDNAASRAVAVRGQNLTDARARERLAVDRSVAGTENVKITDALRKEFNALPEVENYKALVPAQRAATDALSRDTAQADINLIYSAAKIFDPTSVVREGEYATVNNSQPPAERFQGLLSHLTGGGKLTAATRRALLAEINSRANAGKEAYDAARTSYSNVVQKRGLDPKDVFQDLPALADMPGTPGTGGGNRPSLDSFFK